MFKKRGKDYEIGYGRPPRNQFKKGQSGNPNGRPKGAKSLSDRLMKALNELVTIIENGSRRKIPKCDALVKQLLNKALGGDIRSIKLILEMVGPLSERGRQAELEATHGADSTARERLTKKIAMISERIRTGQPLFPEDSKETQQTEQANKIKDKKE
jgi:Family of unknown function (DUF5681)